MLMYPCCNLSMSKQYTIQAIHYVWYIWFPMPREFFEYAFKDLWSLFGLLGFWLCNVKKMVLFSSQEFRICLQCSFWNVEVSREKAKFVVKIEKCRINNVVLKVEQMVLINRQWNLCHMVNNHIATHVQQQGCWMRITFNAMLFVMTCNQWITIIFFWLLVIMKLSSFVLSMWH
jgi:hypothetical protein